VTPNKALQPTPKAVQLSFNVKRSPFSVPEQPLYTFTDTFNGISYRTTDLGTDSCTGRAAYGCADDATHCR